MILSEERKRFVVLDSLRGLCALIVALYHFGGLGHFYNLAFVRNAFLFVDFFFVLSGFVIAHAYVNRLERGTDGLWFLIRRFGRLWPLHTAVLVLLLLVETMKLALTEFGNIPATTPAFSRSTSLDTFFSNLALVHSLGIHPWLSWNIPSWSISTEFYANAVFVLFCLFTPKKSALVRGISALALALAAGSIVLFLAPDVMNTTYSFGLARCLYGFFAGFLCYSIYQAGFSFKWWWEFPAVLAVVVFVSMAGGNILALGAPLVFGLTLLVFSSSAGPVSGLMLARPAVLLGTWSYSIYLVHWVVFSFIERAVSLMERFLGTTLHVLDYTNLDGDGLPAKLISFGNEWIVDAMTLLYLAAVVAIASLTYRFIEEPGRRLFNRVADKWRQSRTVAATRYQGRDASSFDTYPLSSSNRANSARGD
jgi:peptidoglycan/LPS O-acetylase OafA/YrhL